jgi:hypothetical protein
MVRKEPESKQNRYPEPEPRKNYAALQNGWEHAWFTLSYNVFCSTEILLVHWCIGFFPNTFLSGILSDIDFRLCNTALTLDFAKFTLAARAKVYRAHINFN